MVLTPRHLASMAAAVLRAGSAHPVHDCITHIRGAADWLARAQDVHGDGGCAKSFNLLTYRWEPSYPETSGYLIGTLLDLARFFGDDGYRRRAEQMGTWLLSLQLESGAFPAIDRQTPVVFDTGQIMHGLIDLVEQDGGNEPEYSRAIGRAAAWLTEVQDESGAWIHGAYLETPHTYSTRVAWALLRAANLLDEPRYRAAAVRNVEWALTRQQPNGWFRQNSLNDQARPILHTIVYAARGLFEAGRLLDEERYCLAGRRTMEALYERWQADRRLYGAYDAAWHGVVAARCPVGEVQLSGFWMRMADAWGERKYRDAALAVNDGVKRTQNLSTSDANIRGGIPGSSPIYGRYCFLKFPNWAVKFYIDALLLEAGS